MTTFFKKTQYIIYPIIIALFVTILTMLQLNGSGVSLYKGLVFKDSTKEENLIFGRPRFVRSDQFLVTLPFIISEDINNEPLVNIDIGEGTNVITQNIPSRSIFSFFRPTFFLFYLTNNSSLSYAFFWWGEMALLLISTYLLLLELTNKNLIISILGSLLFLLTPFVQWWNQCNIITWISFGLFFFLRIIKEEDWKKSALFGLGFSYSIITFLLILYPPFQIPVVYIALAITIASIISTRKNIKKNLKTVLPVLIGVTIIVAAFVLLYIQKFQDVISITTNTVYPGARFISAGIGDKNWLFNGFYNILLQKDANTAPFGNQSESSNFFLLFPPIIIWVIYKNIILLKAKKKIDWIAICISGVLVFFSLWYFISLPDFISKYSLLYLVPPQRLLIGFGYGSYILTLYILSKDIYTWTKLKSDKILGILLTLSFAILMFVVGKNIENVEPKFFNYPELVSPTIKILLVSLLVSILTLLLFKKKNHLFLVIFTSFAFISSIYINPVHKGLDILTKTDLANYIQETSRKDDSKWIIYENNALAQYALGNNASIINGMHIYPQFEIWRVLDPEKKYIDVYNRYAHINISEYEEGEEYIRLLYPDALEVNINPCDERLDSLNVKYIITYKAMSYSCLELRKDFPEYEIKIYNRSISTTPF